MGLFDKLKGIASDYATNTFNKVKETVMDDANDAIEEAKENAEQEIKNKVATEASKKINESINNYWDNAESKVQNEEGKEAISILRNITHDTRDIAKPASEVDSSTNIEAEKKAQKDMQDLQNWYDKQNNS